MNNMNDISRFFDDDFCVIPTDGNNNGVLAMAFVDMQPLESIYPVAEGFENGTMFPNLNKPFYGGMRR